jgi:hypothetical protein
VVSAAARAEAETSALQRRPFLTENGIKTLVRLAGVPREGEWRKKEEDNHRGRNLLLRGSAG